MSDDVTLSASMTLIGAGLAVAGIVGVLLPSGHRSGAILALLAGAGVGIAGLGMSYTWIVDSEGTRFGDLFLLSSIAGFLTVVAATVLAWRRVPRDPST